MAELQLKAVRKSFQSLEVIHGIDLTVSDGSFTVFVGPSGCGKSTLLRMISGLEETSGGEIWLDGVRCDHLLPSARGMAMVFQSYALYPHMSVEENLRFGLENLKTPKAEISERVQKAAEILQIGHLLKRRPNQLSGGQSQRVAIGRAIVKEPKVFLFDEPLSNLDAELRVKMRSEISALHQRLGTTMIYVTHDQVEAMTMADRIVVLKDGVVQQVGTPMELYENPQSLFVAGFIGSPKMNFLTGPFADKFKAHTVGVRSEHMDIVKDGAWSGKVIYSENLGSDSYIYVDIGSGEPVVVRQPGKASYHSGDQLSFSPRGELFHRFDETGKPMMH